MKGENTWVFLNPQSEGKGCPHFQDLFVSRVQCTPCCVVAGGSCKKKTQRN